MRGKSRLTSQMVNCGGGEVRNAVERNQFCLKDTVQLIADGFRPVGGVRNDGKAIHCHPLPAACSPHESPLLSVAPPQPIFLAGLRTTVGALFKT